MAYKNWTDQEIEELVADPLEVSCKKHQNISRNSLRALRNYHIKKRKKEVEKDPATPNQHPPTGRLKKSWDVAAYDHNLGEWVSTVNSSYEHGDGIEEFEPVEPAKIRPTRAKRVNSASEFVLVYGDGQVDYRRIIDPVTDESKLVPLHDVAMHNVIKQFNARFRPTTTVNLGDFADMAALSRFDPDSDHFHKTLGPSMRYIHDFYAQMVADNPDAHHVETDSNHATRLKKQTLRNMPALHDFVIPGEEYPLMTYYRLANLGRLGIDFISGYGNAQYVIEDGVRNPILFKHGTHNSSSPGSTVKKESIDNPDINVVRGHGHSDEQIMTTRRDGSVLVYKQFGSSCINNGPVPGYHSAVDDHNQPVQYHNKKHQNSFGMIEIFQDGTFNLETIVVVNGITNYRGERFDGNEPRAN